MNTSATSCSSSWTKRGSVENTETLDDRRVMIHCTLPLNEILVDFNDKLKSYHPRLRQHGLRARRLPQDDLVKMDILIAATPVEAFSCIVHRSKAEYRGRQLCAKLKEVIPQQLFVVAIQAAIGGKDHRPRVHPPCAKTSPPNATAATSPANASCWKNKKEGKKRMKAIGKVNIPQEAFIEVLKMWDKIWYGRTWVDIVADQDDVVLLRQGSGYEERTRFKFFTYTRIPLQSGGGHNVPGTIAKVQDLINPRLFLNPVVKKGDVIARGFVDTGDQVIVDKLSYHWIRPERDDVFVFTTNDIPYIQAGVDPRMGSQHYIKRLTGTPGDHLQVREGKLFINGEVASEPGIQRVMSGEGGYRGYSNQGVHLNVQLGDGQYFAMGDNSYNSSDSRTWGHVPERNIVGRALMVYLPFGHHFGPIR
jgi:signal peptidase I